MYIQGNIEADLMRELLPYYIVFSQSNPIGLLMRNNTALNQIAYATQWQLIINTEDDFRQVMARLKERSAETETQLARESNFLLKMILLMQGMNR